MPVFYPPVPENLQMGLAYMGGAVFTSNRTADSDVTREQEDASVANELVSQLPLQMLLYFNMFYFPCWWFSAVFMLEVKFYHLAGYYQALLITGMILLTVIEVARLYLGYIGNLKEKRNLMCRIYDITLVRWQAGILKSQTKIGGGIFQLPGSRKTSGGRREAADSGDERSGRVGVRCGYELDRNETSKHRNGQRDARDGHNVATLEVATSSSGTFVLCADIEIMTRHIWKARRMYGSQTSHQHAACVVPKLMVIGKHSRRSLDDRLGRIVQMCSTPY
ncbi:hypothetical protein F2P81_014294 [Scophthalmus maximus]|uniref:Transmembrane protein 17 n=1 Tax=Scophthalmus maximus TaxID=52904 RepID=A0A6A4SQ57_SCOMX|nr:hypothetical protein F2P81_014294 [Scophthalmus maximus]